jgi:Fe-S cluster biogenesis protein NfuA
VEETERVQRETDLQALIEMMRPAVQADGGDLVITSADVETGVVEVQLEGACSSCAISTTTIKLGVERILKSRLPWVTEVSGGVEAAVDFAQSVSMGRGGYVRADR